MPPNIYRQKVKKPNESKNFCNIFAIFCNILWAISRDKYLLFAKFEMKFAESYFCSPNLIWVHELLVSVRQVKFCSTAYFFAKLFAKSPWPKMPIWSSLKLLECAIMVQIRGKTLGQNLIFEHFFELKMDPLVLPTLYQTHSFISVIRRCCSSICTIIRDDIMWSAFIVRNSTVFHKETDSRNLTDFLKII